MATSRDQKNNNHQNFGIGLQIKLNTFDKMITKGYAELRIIESSKFKEQNLMFRSFYNAKTGETWGIPNKIHPNGDIDWKTIRLVGDVIKYNLNNPAEAREFHVVKNSPFIQGSPTASIDTRYKQFDVEAEASNYIDDSMKMVSAIEWIASMDHNKLIAIGPLFAISPDTNSPTIIRKALLEKARRDPKSILSKKDRETETAILIVVKRAERLNLVKQIPMKGFIYNESIPIGMNENQVVEFLRTNAQILADIDYESKQMDTLHVKATKPVEKPVAPKPATAEAPTF